METITFEPKGVCCKLITIEVENGKVVNTYFKGGCNGNLAAISRLIKGMEISEVVEKLKGTPCNAKQTSCPDQLASCLEEYRTIFSNLLKES